MLPVEHCRSVSTTPYSIAGHAERTRLPPLPRCRCGCSQCTCWTGRRRSSRRCKSSAAGQVHDAVLCRGALRGARAREGKMEPPLQLVHVLDGQTSQLTVMRGSTAVQGPQRRTRSPARRDALGSRDSRWSRRCSRYLCRTPKRRSPQCCDISTAGECPRRRTESPGTRRRMHPRRPRWSRRCSRCTCRMHGRRSSRRCKLHGARWPGEPPLQVQASELGGRPVAAAC